MISKKHFKTKDEVEVTFEADFPDASHVELVGDWTAWEPIAMKQARGKGPFRVKVRLPGGGDHQFRYRIDGHHWANDDGADAYVDNDFGDKNGVVSIG